MCLDDDYCSRATLPHTVAPPGIILTGVLATGSSVDEPGLWVVSATFGAVSSTAIGPSAMVHCVVRLVEGACVVFSMNLTIVSLVLVTIRQSGTLAGTFRRMATLRTCDSFSGNNVTRLPKAASVDLRLDYTTSVLSVITGVVILIRIWFNVVSCFYLQVSCSIRQAI